MNMILFFLLEVVLTLILSLLLVGYLRPYLGRVLTDLCGTEDRARFWTAFSNILLIGMPVIFALNYRPEAGNSEELFFEVAGKLSGNLGSFLFTLFSIGIAVSLFVLVGSISKKVDIK
ncbi:MAG: hypothetical protein ACM3PS_12115 [Syntrophothermus sp.]